MDFVQIPRHANATERSSQSVHPTPDLENAKVSSRVSRDLLAPAGEHAQSSRTDNNHRCLHFDVGVVGLSPIRLSQHGEENMEQFAVGVMVTVGDDGVSLKRAFSIRQSPSSCEVVDVAAKQEKRDAPQQYLNKNLARETTAVSPLSSPTGQDDKKKRVPY